MSTQKRGEEVHAYTRILKYSNKRYGTGLKDLLVLLIAFGATGFIDLFLNENSQGNLQAVLFLVYVFYIFLLLLSFLDFSTGIGIFKDRGVTTSTFMFLIAVLTSGIFSFLAGDVFISAVDSDLMALLLLINLLLSSFAITYFVMTATPNRQGEEEIIRNLTEIKDEVSKLSIAELGVRSSIERSTKWLQFQQSPERIWGVNEPLYETSEIMRAFFEMGKNLGFSWRDVRKGEEDLHKLEQTYYLLLDTLEKSHLAPETTTLAAMLTIAAVKPENLSTERLTGDSGSKIQFKSGLKNLFTEFEEELRRQSEWDFIAELEKLEESFGNRMVLPPIFYFARILHLIDNQELYYRCGEILSETFGILIKRSDSRFSNVEQKDISNYVLGLMYNTLATILRKPVIIGEEAEETTELILPEVNAGELPGSGGMALPSFDDFDDGDMTLPSMDVDVEPIKMNINISMAMVRNLIRRKQEIDGSWSGRIDSTAECLVAVMDRESAESDFIKVAVHYLLALQEKNGSWQNDSLLTSQVLKSLYKVQNSIGGL